MLRYYSWLDFETGGFDPDRCPVFQIANIITDHNLNVLAGFRSYIKPPEGIVYLKENEQKPDDGWYHTEGAFNAHHIDLEEIQNAPSEYKVMALFESLSDEYAPLLAPAGYNTPFDWEKFLPVMEARTGIRIPVDGRDRGLDIMLHAKNHLGNPRSGYKLTDIARKFEIETGGAHDAYRDLEMTIEVARHLI